MATGSVRQGDSLQEIHCEPSLKKILGERLKAGDIIMRSSDYVTIENKEGMGMCYCLIVESTS